MPVRRKPGPPNHGPQASKPAPRPLSVADSPTSAKPTPIAPSLIAPSHRPIPLSATPPIAPPAPTLSKRGNDVRDAYAAMLWQRIAARRPDGLHLPGMAVVLFTLDGTGRLTAIDVRQSSGSALLDRIAVRTVRRAAPFPAPPDGIDDPTFSVAFHFN
ncbi:MAG: TonB family protein [Sphingomonas sp.]|uniref:energy transducer TonB family protein n=1 Tax=Sphingomonas sp. TaxID=28214 RepID=UPI00356A00F2